jgi:hypothetical protein
MWRRLSARALSNADGGVVSGPQRELFSDECVLKDE